MIEPFRIEPLHKSHDRKSFTCGVAALDDYLHTQAGQDTKRLIANCFVMLDNATDAIAGYYSLSAASISLSEFPETLRKKLPRYPNVPAVRIGRLATALAYRGQGLGGALLISAAAKAFAGDVAAFTLLVDAKDQKGALFYEHQGFTRLASRPLSLVLPLATAQAAYNLSPRARR